MIIKYLYLDRFRFMIVTIQFLISFLRDKIPNFDGRADSFRKKSSSKPICGFTEDILQICQEQALTDDGRIEIDEGIHSKRDHSNAKYKNLKRIAG